jgi:hypothetical protein
MLRIAASSPMALMALASATALGVVWARQSHDRDEPPVSRYTTAPPPEPPSPTRLPELPSAPVTRGPGKRMNFWKPLALVEAGAVALIIGLPAAANSTEYVLKPGESVVVRAAVIATPTATASARAPSSEPTAAPTSPSGGSRMSSPCLNISNQSNRVIENLDIGPCNGHGILVYQSQNITIRNVRIRGTQTGINVLESSGVHISDSEITNTERQLVIFDKSSSSSVRRVIGGWTSGGWDGLSAYVSQNITFEGNTVSGGSLDSGCGIIVDGPAPNSGITIRGNTVRDFVNCGIGIANGSNHLIESNQVSNCRSLSNGTENSCVYVWDQYSPEGDCHTIAFRNNNVVDNKPFWSGGNCSNLTLSGNSWQ